MNKNLKFSVAGLIVMVTSLPLFAQSPDSASLEYGIGKDTKLVRVGAQWQWERQWLRSKNGHLGGYWDLSVAKWRQSRYQDQFGISRDITAVGLTPIFQYQANGKTGMFGEAGIGVYRLSSLYDNSGHQLSTKFQFGDHLGVGYRFENAWEASVKLQHFSNGGIKHPNGGVNYLLVRVAKKF